VLRISRKTFEFRLRNASVGETEIDILLGSTKGTVLERTAVVPVGPLIDLVERITGRDDLTIHQAHGEASNPVKSAWIDGRKRRKQKDSTKNEAAPDSSQFELTGSPQKRKSLAFNSVAAPASRSQPLPAHAAAFRWNRAGTQRLQLTHNKHCIDRRAVSYPLLVQTRRHAAGALVN
jgi:hypothetical protein